MKKIFILVAAIATLASCAKENTISANYDAINFGMPFVDNSVRADYSSTPIMEFKVYGTVNDVNIFDGDRVYSENTNGVQYSKVWSCDETQYWIAGAKYKFVGIVDGVKENVTTTTTDERTGLPVSVRYTADGETDLLCQTITKTANTDGTANGLVAFTFTHLLAKAYFTLTNTTPDADYTYTISNVKVTNTYPSATYTLPVYTWNETESKYDVTPASWGSYETASSTEFVSIADVKGNANEKNAELLLIPGAEVGVSFDVTLKIGGEEVTTYNYSKDNVATLAANTIYNFNVSVGVSNTIQFTVTEQPEWDNDHDGKENTADGDTDGDNQVDTPLAI